MPAAAVATYLRGEAAEKNDQFLVVHVVFPLCVPHSSEIRGRVASGRFAGRAKGAARHVAGIRRRPDGDVSVTFRTALVIMGRIQNWISRPGRQVAAR